MVRIIEVDRMSSEAISLHHKYVTHGTEIMLVKYHFSFRVKGIK